MNGIYCMLKLAETVTNKKSIAYKQDVNTAPSDAQKESETYKKGHVTLDGMRIAVENPVGSLRSGTDDDGNTWSSKMKADYGYFKGTVGFDKDHVDVFVKPGYTGGADVVHVVNQYNGSKFDEHKCVLGADTKADALKVYKANYESGWTGGKSVVELPLAEFKTWVYSSKPRSGEFKKHSA